MRTGESVTYSWRVRDTGASCQLDIRADGTPDYTLACATGSQTHTFAKSGSFPATLKVTSGTQSTSQIAPVVTVAETNADFTELTWKQTADSPVDRHEAFGGVAADGKFYIFGGYSDIRQNRFRPTKQVDSYDPQTGIWERKADLPQGISHAGIAISGNNIYFAGGYPEVDTSFGQTFSTQKVWQYNTVSDSYTALPDLPSAHGGGALALIDRFLHYYGGTDENRKDSNEHWKLEVNSGPEWSPAAGLPVPRNHLGSAVINGKIYAVGGQSGQDAKAVYRDDVHVYDPATDTWTEVASLPMALSHNNGSTFEMGGRIIVLGGEPAYGRSVADAFAYDPQKDQWQTLTSMPIAKNAGVGGNTSNAVFHMTGSTSKDVFRGTPR